MKLQFDEKNPGVLRAIIVMLTSIETAPPELIVNEVTTNTDKAQSNSTENLDPPDLTTQQVDTGVELDSANMPWDARIHAKTKTKNADLTWKTLRRPKVQFPTDAEWKAFIATVEAELKAPPANNFGSDTALTGATTEVLDPPPLEEEPEMSFKLLMKTITGSGGKVSATDLQEICDSYEIKKPTDLNKLENKILLPSIYDEVMEIINGE